METGKIATNCLKTRTSSWYYECCYCNKPCLHEKLIFLCFYLYWFYHSCALRHFLWLPVVLWTSNWTVCVFTFFLAKVVRLYGIQNKPKLRSKAQHSCFQVGLLFLTVSLTFFFFDWGKMKKAAQMTSCPTLLQLNILVSMQWLFCGPCFVPHISFKSNMVSILHLLCQVCVAFKDCLLVAVQACFG